MDRDLGKSLNWFLLLEINQVQLYKAQAHQVADTHLREALNRFAQIEQEHVEKIATLLRQMGGDVGWLTAACESSWGKQFARLGMEGIMSAVDKIGEDKLLSIAILGEQRAIADYKKLIAKTPEPWVLEVLWANLIDEELHSGWMKNYLTGKQNISP
ncbi:MAG: ferritin-like domain-containing protein [Clostridia bacterium]|nr:ferritin-like domain-containing protein [Clostridia bacterium]